VDSSSDGRADVNPVAIGEIVGEAPAWTRRLSRRQSARTRQLLRCGGDRGAGGCTSGREMILTGLGFKGQPCD
jgi:hypothetical protein